MTRLAILEHVRDVAEPRPSTADIVAEFHAELIGTFLKRPRALWSAGEITNIVNNRVQELHLRLIERERMR